VSAKVQEALHVLDDDPHYRYEQSFGEGEPPDLAARDRRELVFTYFSGDQQTGKWMVIDVIARCEASTTARPITMRGTFEADPEGEFGQEFRDFFTYGVGFASPAGSATLEIDAPGGLGGTFNNGTVQAWINDPDAEDGALLRAETLNLNGDVVATVHLTRAERTQGQGGVRVLLKEEHGVFAWEQRVLTTDLTGSRVLSLGEITGQPVAVVAPALRFLDSLREPNVVRPSDRYGASSAGVLDNSFATGGTDSGGFWAAVTQLRLIADALETMQHHASTVVRMPDLQTVTQTAAESWLRAA